ncbi:hypothetical protein KSB_79510 [Ktedonobacter robiniae]|uniref:Uncharacterized protein n=1 Tax=Ktedonobacter robiniae TaxID=2778365 RepID=A0ABQ3V3E0_9CHLR|nr:hypothetical protein KSB_79510 [Ktedonobacter robiniae]
MHVYEIAHDNKYRDDNNYVAINVVVTGCVIVAKSVVDDRDLYVYELAA